MDLSNVQITQDCLVTMSHWGKDVVTNVCNGTVTEVAWGTLNYVNYTIGAGAVLIALALLGFLVYLFIQDL